MKKDKRFRQIAILALVGIVIWQIVGGMLPYLAKGIKALTPFLVAFATAYLLRHPVIWLEKLLSLTTKKKVRPWQHAVASVTVLILFVGLAALLVAITVPQIISNITDIITKMPTYVDIVQAKLEKWITDLSERLNVDVNGYVLNFIDSFGNRVVSQVSSFGTVQKIAEYATGAVSSLTSMAFNGILYLMATFYLLFDFDRIKSWIKRSLRLLFREEEAYRKACAFCHNSDQTIEKYIVVKMCASLGLGLIAYIGFLIMGLPYAILLATVVAVTNLVPIIGPIVGAIPPILIGLTVSDGKMALVAAIFILICQQLEGNVITPLLTGGALKVSPLLVLAGIAIFGSMMGVWGMILGAPIAAILAGTVRSAVELTEQAVIKEKTDNAAQ